MHPMLKKEWKERLTKIQEYLIHAVGPMAEWRVDKIHIHVEHMHSYMGCRFGTACGGLDLFVAALDAADLYNFPEKHVQIVFEDKVLAGDDLDEFYYLAWEHDSFIRRKERYFKSLSEFVDRF